MPNNRVAFETLKGVTFSLISVNDEGDEINFCSMDGRQWVMKHEQDCCEHVSIDDICGDLQWLVGSPVLLAEEVSSSDCTPGAEPAKYEGTESYTWTFYKLATVNGSVTIRWYGTSNGYYSESVSLLEVIPDCECDLCRQK